MFEADYQQDEAQPMPEKPNHELPVEQPTPGVRGDRGCSQFKKELTYGGQERSDEY